MRLRQKVQDLQCNGIDAVRRDCVLAVYDRKRLPGIGVVDWRRERPLALKVGGKRACCCDALPDSADFKVAEEEGLVVNDRAANRATKLISSEGWFGGTSRSEIVFGIQRGIANEFIANAMKLIGARLDRSSDDPGRGASVLRRVSVGNNLEFLNGVNRRLDNVFLP